jgi:hypothetical protein
MHRLVGGAMVVFGVALITVATYLLFHLTG